MKKYSILMYNFNNYEVFREPKEIDPEAEYIYVTDNENLKSNIWNIIVDKKLSTMSVFDKCYWVRFHLFNYCNTNICIYLDGSMQINKSLNKLVNDFIKSNCDIGLNVHHNRTTIIEDYKKWVDVCNYPKEKAFKNMNYMEKHNYNLNYKGLYQGCLRIVKNTELNKNIDDLVYSALKEMGENNIIERQDQVVFSYILNNNFNYINVFPIATNFVCSKYITWCKHGKYEPKKTEKRVYNNKGYVFNKLVSLYNG